MDLPLKSLQIASCGVQFVVCSFGVELLHQVCGVHLEVSFWVFVHSDIGGGLEWKMSRKFIKVYNNWLVAAKRS